MVKQIIGYLFILTSILDGLKYIWAANAVKKAGTAKGNSRKFLCAAIFNDIVKLIYGCVIIDIFIISSSLFALFTMCYNFYIVYLFYPYKYRNLNNFKRPGIIIYIYNSLQPNKWRRRL
ncbi:MAG: hypothetical protein PHD31_02640 [Candidatus Pacebacteria bacterium]|jgi:hypothetical protein|nr:hypothetical protein [Candidatus Paceibacterota bacterium]